MTTLQYIILQNVLSRRKQLKGQRGADLVLFTARTYVAVKFRRDKLEPQRVDSASSFFSSFVRVRDAGAATGGRLVGAELPTLFREADELAHQHDVSPLSDVRALQRAPSPLSGDVRALQRAFSPHSTFSADPCIL
jgi:uncharacterized protein (DUF1501 family)